MPSYLYKGVNISTITDVTSNNSNNFYKGFPTGTPSGNLFKPNDFGYKDPSGDLSNRCKAKYDLVSISGDVTPPIGAKEFRYIIFGGGGAGGGGGGHAHMESKTIKTTSNANGGNGAPGAGAVYLYSPSAIKINSGPINLVIGNGGTAAAYTKNANLTLVNTNKDCCKGGDGGGNTNPPTPGPGNSTYFNYDGIAQIEAYGGLAGGWGEGGKACLTNGANKNGNIAGSTIGPTNLDPAVQINPSLGGPQIYMYGMGGSGGVGSTSGNIQAIPGGNGNQGAAEFIWLYD
jgi:hypothetical protein